MTAVQEDDLGVLRDRWTEALDRRRHYLSTQLQEFINKADKSRAEAEREQLLVEQWVRLTDERNAVTAPADGSGVPGAPAPPGAAPAAPGCELHVPVLFLDLEPGSLGRGGAEAGAGELQPPVFGHNSILPKELAGRFFGLPLVCAVAGGGAGAVASWDSSIHESVSLNRLTQATERAYLIVKVVVRLSHPLAMDLVLRKRLCFNVIKRQSLTEKIRKRLGHAGGPRSVSVLYEVVSNIPVSVAELEDRESLAVLAAAADTEQEAAEGDTYMAQYAQGLAAVETLLHLDRLRQSVAVKEKLKQGGAGGQQQQHMRKTMSVPNFVQMSQSFSLDNMSSLQMRSSISFHDSQELTGR